MKEYYNIMTPDGFLKAKELRTHWDDIWTDKQIEAHKFDSEHEAINYDHAYIEYIVHDDWVISKIVE